MLLAVQVAVFAVTVVAGLAFSPYGELFRLGKRLLDLGPPPAVEHEAAPRFAQLCGLVVAGAGLAALGVGSTAVGWSLAGVVLALSTLLATTGVCVGCALHLPIAPAAGGPAPSRPPGARGGSRPDRPVAVSADPLRVDRATQSRLGLEPVTSGPRAVLFGSATCSPCDTVRAVLDDIRGREHPDLEWQYVDAADHLDVADDPRHPPCADPARARPGRRGRRGRRRASPPVRTSSRRCPRPASEGAGDAGIGHLGGRRNQRPQELTWPTHHSRPRATTT